MIHSTSHEPAPAKRGFSFSAALIFLMPLVILIGSTTLYLTGWRGGDTVNNGNLLIEQQQQWSPASLGRSEQERQQLAQAHEGKWLIVQLLDCQNCNAELDQLSRLHQAFGKHQGRISPVAIGQNGLENSKISLHLRESPEAYAFFKAMGAQQDRFIVDPQGWVVLGYDARHSNKMLLKDLKRLL